MRSQLRRAAIAANDRPVVQRDYYNLLIVPVRQLSFLQTIAAGSGPTRLLQGETVCGTHPPAGWRLRERLQLGRTDCVRVDSK